MIALALLGSVLASEPPHPTRDLLGGGSDPERWALGLSGGYPWLGAQAQLGLERGWTPHVRFDSALFRRNSLAFGVGKRWLDGERLRLTGEASIGWLVQTGELAESGPDAELRLRLCRNKGRLIPYAIAASRHGFRFDQTVITGVDGVQRDTSMTHQWSLDGELGLGVVVTERIGIAAAIDLPWIDLSGLSIPGAHLALQVGGAR